MKKDFLKEIPKSNKIEFLSKLKSGQFTLLPLYEPQPKLNFDLQENGLYKCKETGKILSQGQISNLPGYRMSIGLVSTREQVNQEKPPSGIVLMPYSKEEYLNSLLKNKSDVVITYDESDKMFKSTTESYSFEKLKRINNESPEVVFLMDEKTKLKYIELLEKWC